VARASELLVIAEQLQMRRNEWLQTTNNPTDMMITGIKGRAAVLRESAKSLKMPADKVVPDEEALNDILLTQAGVQPIGAGATGGGGGSPAAPQQALPGPGGPEQAEKPGQQPQTQQGGAVMQPDGSEKGNEGGAQFQPPAQRPSPKNPKGGGSK